MHVPAILYVDSKSARSRRAVAWLDVCGVNYLLKDVRKDSAASRALSKIETDLTPPVLTWDKHVLKNFTRPQLVEFLWARGVTLEDS